MTETKFTPGADLTVKQKKAAKKLRTQRPMTVPGTNTIISASEAKVWYDDVSRVAVDNGVTYAQLTAFCDLAGILS